MRELVAHREIDREADEHISLGRLLQRQRDEESKRAVDRILASDLRIPQKIERIREIDEKQNSEEIEQIVRRAYWQAARRRSAKIRQSIKVPQKSAGYLAFLFREMRRIRDFGNKTHVLETGFFPPGVRITRGLQGFLVRSLQHWAVELSSRLKLVNDHGWLHLTPLQYNLVRTLKQLCERILAFDFVHLNYRSRDLIDKLKRIETLFLILHYRSNYLNSILSSLALVYKKQGEDEEEGIEAQNLAFKILARDAALPSLYNCLVGLNIVRHRRLLSLSDLMRPGLGETVNGREFECDPEVRERIETYSRDSVESIKKLHSQLQEVRRLNSYLDLDGQGNTSDAILRRLYRADKGKEDRNYEADKQNLLLFILRLFQAFYRLYFPLLSGKIQIASVGRSAIFSRSFYELELARLGGMIEKLRKGPFHFSKFPLDRYLQLKNNRIGAIGNESEFVQLIDEGVADLVDLGKSLAKVLSLDLGPAMAGEDEPLEPTILQGKPFRLPHGQRKIEKSPFLEGKTVVEALSSAVSFCFTAGVLFQDRFVYFFLGKERRFEMELASRMELLKNLLDPEKYQELSSLYR